MKSASYKFFFHENIHARLRFDYELTKQISIHMRHFTYFIIIKDTFDPAIAIVLNKVTLFQSPIYYVY